MSALSETDRAVLGGGCFWCLEASYQLIRGVTKVVSGYSGGIADHPSYEDLHYSNSGHAEVVQITFDSSTISYSDILDIFWAIHDPTTLNRQGNDVGPEYRSIILYVDEKQRRIAEASKAKIQSLWTDPVTTEIKSLKHFYEAEEEHHNFFKKHPEAGYCQVIINPKLDKLRAKFADRLK